MAFKMLTILALVFPLVSIGQNSLAKLPVWPNQNSSVSITKDSNFLVSTAGSKNICLVRSDLKKVKSTLLKAKLELSIQSSLALKDGIIITGTLYPKNATQFSKAWLFVVKLDTCMLPVWQKTIELKEEYLDTTITNNITYLTSIINDENGNLYLFSVNEMQQFNFFQKDNIRPTSMIYKFDSKGQFQFRKQILERSHTSLSPTKIIFKTNYIYVAGYASFPLFGQFDTISNIAAARSVLLKIDTSGNLLHSKILEDEPYFANFTYDIFCNNKKNQIASWGQGRHADTIKNYRESRELIMNLDLEPITMNISNEKDSLFSFIQMFAENGKKEPYFYKSWQQTSQLGRNAFTRTGYGYLHKLDSNLKTIDSSTLDFFTPKNDKDSVYNIAHILPNPLVDTILTFFGKKKKKSSSFYYFAVNVNSKGQAIDSLPISNFPSRLCYLDYSNSEVLLSNFDSLVFTTKFDHYYNDPPTSVDELSLQQKPKLIPYPNPASNQICFNDDFKINKVDLFTMQGNFISQLNHENSCFKTPSNYSDGLYLLKVSLENGEEHFCKIYLQTK